MVVLLVCCAVALDLFISLWCGYFGLLGVLLGGCGLVVFLADFA